MKAKMHYCGNGIKYMLAGWPVCGSGDFAVKVRSDGNQTTDINQETCKKCKLKIDRDLTKQSQKMG